MIIPVFIPQGGCTERCTFCDQRVSGGKPVSLNALKETINTWLATRKKADCVTRDLNDSVEVAFYGGTFTALSSASQLAYLDTVRVYLEAATVDSVRISTRPDAVQEEWMQTLAAKYKLKTVELGVQNFNEKSLQAMGRSHSVASVYRAVEILKKNKIQAGLHLMIGCPAENTDEDLNTIKHVLDLKPQTVRIHPLIVIRGTKIEKKYQEGRFAPIVMEEAVSRASLMTDLFEKNGIKVIRLGLQSQEILRERVVAGAFHPAFGELVRARLVRERVSEMISKALQTSSCSGSHPKVIKFEVPERLLSQFKGQHSCNLEWLKARFNLSSVDAIVLKTGNHEKCQIRICNPNRSA